MLRQRRDRREMGYHETLSYEEDRLSGAVGDLAALEEALGLSFKNRGLLTQALTHASYGNEHPGEVMGSNERLEFLGDALVGLVVGAELYRRYPGLDEGVLTDLRSLVVRGATLARVGRRLGLGGHLLLGQGEAASGGKDRDSNLAGAMEAVVGAVLLDRAYRVARACVLRVLRPELRGIATRGATRDPKSQLQELAHQRGMSVPTYREVAVEGPEHERRYLVEVSLGDRVLGNGRDRRKADAERRAAEAALKVFP